MMCAFSCALLLIEPLSCSGALAACFGWRVSSVPSAGLSRRCQARSSEVLGAAQVFSKDETGMLRSWGPRANIPAVNQKAREAASQLLAQLAVLRIDSKQVILAWQHSLLSLHQDLA